MNQGFFILTSILWVLTEPKLIISKLDLVRTGLDYARWAFWFLKRKVDSRWQDADEGSVRTGCVVLVMPITVQSTINLGL